MENSNDNHTVVIAGNNMNNVSNHSVVPENPAVGPMKRALKHEIELSVNWSREEQSLLEELHVKYASHRAIMRYSKIAVQLQDKTVRDVALRSRWMLNKEIKKKETSKQIKDESNSSRRHKEIRRVAQIASSLLRFHLVKPVFCSAIVIMLQSFADEKQCRSASNPGNKEIKKKETSKQIKDESNSSRRHKEIRGYIFFSNYISTEAKRVKMGLFNTRQDRQEKPTNQVADASFYAESIGNGHPDVQPSTSMDNDDIISIAIGGVTGQLLDQINRAMDQVYANFSAFRENSDLLEVLNHFPGTPEMPHVPIKLNDELVNFLLHLQ
ncbi:Homeodomain-like protein [Artemisia annua]|uniref:Homeodomain-like protein n=1 Tax=Artemisia annua TaxID=35608 RepID=A0A2U1PZZ0_ARTAN|nr:Homeodomain-like protein [Artemisia annua]